MDSFTIPQGSDVERRIRTPLQELVYAVGKGAARVAVAAELPVWKLEYLLKQDRKAKMDQGGRVRSVRDVSAAEALERASIELGTHVPLLELLGVSRWLGPDLHGPDPKVRRRAQNLRASAPAQNRTGTYISGARVEVARAA